MAVRVEWRPNGRLAVSGDMTGVLRLPPEGEDGLFQLAFSDGTLAQGGCGKGGACFFRIAREGAGIVRVIGDDCQAIELDWNVEWVTVADLEGGLIATGDVHDLPLFPELTG